MSKLTLTKAEKDAVTAVETKYSQDAKAKGEKYEQVLRKSDGAFEVEVHEYVTPDKTPGYQKIIRQTKDAKVYRKSVGVGPESTVRTYDWVEEISEEV